MASSDQATETGDALPLHTRTVEAARECFELGNSLIPEINLLVSRLEKTHRPSTLAGLITWVRGLQKDQRSLQRLVDDELGSATALPETQLKAIANKIQANVIDVKHAHLKWSILKRCHSFQALNQTFLSSTKESRREVVSSQESISGREKQLLHRTLKEQSRVEVDVVERGSEWIDIKSISLDRLARQMTDSGWGWGDHELGDVLDEEDWGEVPLAKQIKRLVEAAKRNRHEYRIPRVRVVLPRIQADANNDVAVFINQLRNIDSQVEVIINDSQSDFLTSEPPQLESAIENLAGDELAGLTPILNMDHTILIDLISDITHYNLEPQPWQASTTQAQIKEENRHPDGLMAPTLYPLLRGRKLICTKEAAEHFHEVLSTVGTNTERQRGHLLVPRDPETLALSPSDIHAKFSSLSVRSPPADLQIPVTILSDPTDFQAAVKDGRLPEVALDVARCGGFKSSKLSIYMHGWAEGITTITSNKEIRGHIRTWVEAHRRTEDEVGPSIYRVDVTRNLLAKAATPPDSWPDGGYENGDDGSN
ncbi:unnamed protein product [Clonostachys rhizophaga]|uniref:DUF1308 domain-containing protein n=1 Tax=Clonostachys rhizophaga TaxID=160324 RepID=A0A9N9VHZ7_9HYPO|nr:unnamed protein product [Clonostachys rhizophaga]